MNSHIVENDTSHKIDKLFSIVCTSQTNEMLWIESDIFLNVPKNHITLTEILQTSYYSHISSNNSTKWIFAYLKMRWNTLWTEVHNVTTKGNFTKIILLHETHNFVLPLDISFEAAVLPNSSINVFYRLIIRRWRNNPYGLLVKRL